MLNGLFTIFKTLFDSLFYVLREMWRQTGLLLGTVWAWACALTGVVIWGIDLVNDGIINLMGYMDYILSVTFPSIPSTSSFTNLFNLGNTLFPLTEAVAFLLVYATVLTVFTLYRTIKSWIPTLS